MLPVFCYMSKDYYASHGEFCKMLDENNIQKQIHRLHLNIAIVCGNKTFYIPLRNNLGSDVRSFGRIGHSISSENRQNAGLDYRHALLAKPNDVSVVLIPAIPNSQYRKILDEYDVIVKEFTHYLKGFKKAVRKGRVQKEPLYRESSLINFDLTDLDI